MVQGFSHRVRWVIQPIRAEVVARIQREVGVSEILARLLVNRGITEPEQAVRFLYPDWQHLPDPFLLPDARIAVERLLQAIERGEKVLVYGDYDVDGVTSAALWYHTLSKLRARVLARVPHRKRDGYDIRVPVVDEAHQQGVSLILTCDCGIQAHGVVERARELGIDVIITDHHEPGEEVPQALAVVNPHLPHSRYPFADLSGVGVSYRLGEALVQAKGFAPQNYRNHFLDLATLGTIADVMPLMEENRVFAWYGLHSIPRSKRPGVQALLSVARVSADKPVTMRQVQFALAPRINAVGRLDDAAIALELLTTDDPQRALHLAQELEEHNRRRRSEQHRILGQALEQAKQRDIAREWVLVLTGEEWDKGVIGIVASKVLEQYHRPTVMISLDAECGIGRGSARSIRSYDIFRAIEERRDLFIECGGHTLAAGFSIRVEHIEELREHLNRLAHEWMSPEDLLPRLDIDADIEPADVTPTLVDEIARMEPFGHGNPEPMFLTRGLTILEKRRVGDGSHWKLTVRGEALPPTGCIAFGMGEYDLRFEVGDEVDVVHTPQWNEFNGRREIQLQVHDIRHSSGIIE
ncbi:MAG: single-stranded-DNA-specific exonuclease RecJ [Armatimonadota bacterium]|nr:single-stranded-DNA-specific exonuclease RecJ [bacterium]MDW8321151.1 single-stranded-DNA-specific exonuclease RecJ [Armatimonadota bacterium]